MTHRDHDADDDRSAHDRQTMRDAMGRHNRPVAPPRAPPSVPRTSALEVVRSVPGMTCSPLPGHRQYSDQRDGQRLAERYVVAYVECVDSRDAYKRARALPASYVLTPKDRGRISRLSNHAVVQEEISRRLESKQRLSEITTDRIQIELAKMAFVNVADMYDVEHVFDEETGAYMGREVNLKEIVDMSPDVASAVVGIKETKTGRLIPELTDKRGALMDLAKLSGMIVDKKQVALKAHVTHVIETDDLDDETLDALTDDAESVADEDLDEVDDDNIDDV